MKRVDAIRVVCCIGVCLICSLFYRADGQDENIRVDINPLRSEYSIGEPIILKALVSSSNDDQRHIVFFPPLAPTLKFSCDSRSSDVKLNEKMDLILDSQPIVSLTKTGIVFHPVLNHSLSFVAVGIYKVFFEIKINEPVGKIEDYRSVNHMIVGHFFVTINSRHVDRDELARFVKAGKVAGEALNHGEIIEYLRYFNDERALEIVDENRDIWKERVNEIIEIISEFKTERSRDLLTNIVHNRTLFPDTTHLGLAYSTLLKMKSLDAKMIFDELRDPYRNEATLYFLGYDWILKQATEVYIYKWIVAEKPDALLLGDARKILKQLSALVEVKLDPDDSAPWDSIGSKPKVHLVKEEAPDGASLRN